MTKQAGPAPQDKEEQTFRLDHEITRKYDPTALSKLIVRDSGRGEALDLHTRSAMERRLGGSFGGVRIYRGPLAEEVTSRYRADAVTVGGTEMILVREGWQSNFSTVQGGALLAHELTHVRQQQRGLHFHGAGDTSSPLEREAHSEQDAYAQDFGNQADNAAHEEYGKDLKAHMTEVMKEALKLFEKEKQEQDLRSNPNSQSEFGGD